MGTEGGARCVSVHRLAVAAGLLAVPRWYDGASVGVQAPPVNLAVLVQAARARPPYRAPSRRCRRSRPTSSESSPLALKATPEGPLDPRTCLRCSPSACHNRTRSRGQSPSMLPAYLSTYVMSGAVGILVVAVVLELALVVVVARADAPALALQLPFGTWNVATSPLYVIRSGTAPDSLAAPTRRRTRAPGDARGARRSPAAAASPAASCFSGAPTAPVAATAASIMESFIIAFCGGGARGCSAPQWSLARNGAIAPRRAGMRAAGVRRARDRRARVAERRVHPTGCCDYVSDFARSLEVRLLT